MKIEAFKDGVTLMANGEIAGGIAVMVGDLNL